MKRIFTIACMVAICLAFTSCKCKCCKCDKAAEEPAAVETVCETPCDSTKCEGCEGCDKKCEGCNAEAKDCAKECPNGCDGHCKDKAAETPAK